MDLINSLVTKQDATTLNYEIFFDSDHPLDLSNLAYSHNLSKVDTDSVDNIAFNDIKITMADVLSEGVNNTLLLDKDVNDIIDLTGWSAASNPENIGGKPYTVYTATQDNQIAYLKINIDDNPIIA